VIYPKATSNLNRNGGPGKETDEEPVEPVDLSRSESSRGPRDVREATDFAPGVQQSKRFVPGFLVGVKDIDFVGRPEAETP
jgi:hypothetical protein